jgi:ATP-dependent Clp protease ATP-binding subunit ClpA
MRRWPSAWRPCACVFDKLTTAFQQALPTAQSLAVARDNPYIEPAHVLAAMLQQPDGPRRCSTAPAPTPRR